MTTRREFMTMLGGAAAAWPLAARAQPTVRKRPPIGFLGTSAKIFGARHFEGFTQGMSDVGYRDYSLDDRYANNDLGRLPAPAEELVRLRPDVVVASSSASALAMKRATSNIPIVAATVTDPVGLGLVLSE